MADGARCEGAVLFDLDGTLVDREPLAAAALVGVCAEQGWHLADPWPDALMGRAWQDVFRELGVAEHLGWDEATFTERVTSRCIEVEREVGVPALEGAVELVEALAVRGVRLGLVTGSTGREAAMVLERLGVAEAFEHLVTAEQYAVGKPAPDPYVAALRRFGLPAARVVAVEDSAVGVASARGAELRVVVSLAAHTSRRAPAPNFGAADLVVPTLADPDLLNLVLGVVAPDPAVE